MKIRSTERGDVMDLGMTEDRTPPILGPCAGITVRIHPKNLIDDVREAGRSRAESFPCASLEFDEISPTGWFEMA